MRVEVVSYITLGERCVNFIIMGCPLRAEDVTILISSKLTTCLSVFVTITVLASQGSFRKKEELIMLHRAHQSLKIRIKSLGFSDLMTVVISQWGLTIFISHPDEKRVSDQLKSTTRHENWAFTYIWLLITKFINIHCMFYYLTGFLFSDGFCQLLCEASSCIGIAGNQLKFYTFACKLDNKWHFLLDHLIALHLITQQVNCTGTRKSWMSTPRISTPKLSTQMSKSAQFNHKLTYDNLII